ncbi:glutaminyl-peptide cyclotransferase [Oleiagrimonas sp. C23AA]|uniref:glutaminyl-peptide cyclotransferase n=1 Tax=Oleiagrimonas sp. C23AA TaxID=2719047 RepID=UPI001F0E15B9|nr:glutaminyl-peptide cyclotransferase [Oleiagrimonas sp. C23AA]
MTFVAQATTIPVYGFKVVKRYPHDTSAFTEGLFYKDGVLYESTGEAGQSRVRKVDLETGKSLQEINVPPAFFGEGIVAWGKHLIQLTWQHQIGFIYDLKTLKRVGTFHYKGQGWALTRNDTHIFMSDGSPTIRVLDPDTLKVVRTITVTADGQPVQNVNELEWVKGQLYANIWLKDIIARIDPKTGHVVGWINLENLFDNAMLPDPTDDVLNGIAYDAKHDRLFVTGKCWPWLYEIKLTAPH